MPLERSSNVYMIKLAMKMGGQSKYEKGGRLNINLSLFDKLREYYAQFGLGVRTGIDLPNEGKDTTVVQPMPSLHLTLRSVSSTYIHRFN